MIELEGAEEIPWWEGKTFGNNLDSALTPSQSGQIESMTFSEMYRYSTIFQMNFVSNTVDQVTYFSTTAISCVNSTNKGALSYIINRSTDTIIGGTDYINDWNENVEESDTKLILQRLETSGLSNKKPQILETVVGLRPLRHEVRFEFDQEFENVFHNYGHGGAGFTVAWGCAIKLGAIFNSHE